MMRGNNIHDIINSAKVKINLQGDKFKLTLVNDNTEIENNEIMRKYIEEYKNKSNKPTTMLLSSENFTNHYKQQDSNMTNFTNRMMTNIPDWNDIRASTSGMNKDASNPISYLTSSATVSSDLTTHVWSKAPFRLMICCQEKKEAYPKDRKSLVGLTADYIVNVMKDTTRKTSALIAEKIYKQYPDTFCDKIDGTVYGSGFESLKLQVYNAVLYRKTAKNGPKKRKMSKMDSDDEQKRQDEKINLLKQDEYGCVEYYPELSQNETAETQEEKRLKMLDMFYNLNRDENEVHRLMDETYATQRAAINVKDRDLKAVTTNWPFLKDVQCLILHLNRLIGKNILDIWGSFIRTKLRPLRQFLKTTNKYKAEKKNILSEIILQCSDACKALRSDIPKTLIIIRLLLLYFNEKEDYFFKIITGDITEENIINEAPCDNPVILIKGNSLYDVNSTFTVVLERSVIIFCFDAVQAILALFASYFVFGYAYPTEIEKTLEYLQREIFKINPSAGSKRGSKRRKSTTYDAAVFKLAKDVLHFQNQ